jgi:hypothetical protein
MQKNGTLLIVLPRKLAALLKEVPMNNGMY